MPVYQLRQLSIQVILETKKKKKNTENYIKDYKNCIIYTINLKGCKKEQSFPSIITLEVSIAPQSQVKTSVSDSTQHIPVLKS